MPYLLCGFPVVLIGEWGRKSVHICTPQLDWHAAAGDQSYPRCRGSMSWPLFNHVLHAGADKRCKGDYGSRRTSLCRGLGTMALCCVLTWRMNTSVFRLQCPLGVTELLERFWNGDERLEPESNALGLCVICELIPFWWAQQMTVRMLIAF